MKNQVQNNVLERKDAFTWDEIIDKSNNLQNSTVFQLSTSTPSYAALKNNSLSAIEEFVNKPNNTVEVKIYIDGEIISDALRYLTDHPKDISETLKTWKNRILPNRSLVIRLGASTIPTNELHSSLHNFLLPLLESSGIPLGGIAVSFEFGDHEWSPYGLEEDVTPKNKLMINIGETKQVVYEWTPKKKEELGGLIMKKGKMQNFMDYLDNYSEKNEIAEDEMAVISNQGMYIAKYEGFYHRIQIRLGDMTKEELLHEMLLGLASATMSVEVHGKEANILPVYDTNKHDEFTQEMLKNLKYTGNDLSLSMRDLLKKSFKDISYVRRSNGGFVGSVKYIEDKAVDTAFRTISDNAKIKLKKSELKIEYYSLDDKTYLFMRGQKTVVKQSNFINEMIDKLNQGNSIAWKTLTESDNWQLSGIQKLIKLAYKFRAVEITNLQ
ncbi:hypothetical protein [Kordia sp.]|uniref:hypothetical protein n=1 Tax=Kordia sp. TaxID=1965332 RepID=UPI003D2CAC75